MINMKLAVKAPGATGLWSRVHARRSFRARRGLQQRADVGDHLGIREYSGEKQLDQVREI